MPNVLLLGDPGTGKSSWLYRLKGYKFTMSYLATIGKDTHILRKNDRTVIIHDMGGYERFRSVTQSYYDLADGALIFYDVTNKESKEKLEFWKNKITKDIPILIIANKKDLDKDNIDYIDFLISCKQDENISWVLDELLKDIPHTPEEPTILEQLLETFYLYYIRYYNRFLT